MGKMSNLDIQINTILELAANAPAGIDILAACLDITEMLLGKNVSYGNSALEPINIFSNANASEQIATRIDDKLNRIKLGKEYAQEDTVLDLIGYLLLYRLSLSSK